MSFGVSKPVSKKPSLISDIDNTAIRGPHRDPIRGKVQLNISQLARPSYATARVPAELRVSPFLLPPEYSITYDGARIDTGFPKSNGSSIMPSWDRSLKERTGNRSVREPVEYLQELVEHTSFRNARTMRSSSDKLRHAVNIPFRTDQDKQSQISGLQKVVQRFREKAETEEWPYYIALRRGYKNCTLSVGPAGVNKEDAIQHLKSQGLILPSQIIYAGDGKNDLPPLTAADGRRVIVPGKNEEIWPVVSQAQGSNAYLGDPSVPPYQAVLDGLNHFLAPPKR